MRPKESKTLWPLATALGLTVAVFGIDLLVPLGFAGGVLYLFPLLVSSRSPNPLHTIIIAAAGSALTAAGFLLSPSGGELWAIVLNRPLALLAI